MTERYRADHVVLPDAVLEPGWVEIDGTRIAALDSGEPERPAHDLGQWLLPGFVDIHCHGGGGATFSGGRDEARSAADLHAASGTTAMLASLVSAPVDDLADQVGVLAAALDEDALGPVRGIHLEGPYLADSHRGAHDPDVLRSPGTDDVERLLRASRGWLTMVTLAPELPGAASASRRLTAQGVTVAIGHTAATYEQAGDAFAAGARVLTHAGNAMPAAHHRAPGPVVAALDDSDCHVELILDGVHLHDAWARRVMDAAGDRAVLVTDAMAAAGRGDGRYRLGSLDVVVSDGVARIGGDGSIAGSVLRMDAAFARAAGRLGFGAVRAAHAAATAPARAMGWSDELGRIAVGLSASFVVTDDRFAVERVMCNGEWTSGGPEATGR